MKIRTKSGRLYRITAESKLQVFDYNVEAFRTVGRVLKIDNLKEGASPTVTVEIDGKTAVWAPDCEIRNIIY